MSIAQSNALRPEFQAALHEASRFFETPFYAYDLESLRNRIETLQAAFPSAEIFYAMKANPRLGLLRRFLEWGLNLEAVSLGEVHRAYRAGFQRTEVLLNGPVKTPATLEELAEIGIPILGLDSLADIRRVAQILPGSRVLLRVNPDLPISTHDHLATGRGESKFGILPEDLGEALDVARKGDLEVLGLHVHLGSALSRPEDYHAGYEVMRQLYLQHGPFEVLNLGGGFGLDLNPAELAPSATALAKAFDAELWLEPGRYLVAEAGVLVTKIWGTKRTRRNFMLVDAGMMTLLRPMLYGAQHPILPLYTGRKTETWDLAGPVCESGDILAKEVRLPTPKEGDALAILQAGAYGSSMSSNYLDYPRPLELLWNGGEWEVLRRKQSWESLFADEL
ncbi:diaminopimelate decarboxylase [Meiothermus granaticius]|uniref:Diaminopimelate decarboxylase n=1 Tax=Meiothermus granaticius NBRC 107808 TaxID=1227551 RepID=A0A399F7U9_9DEIN|nr:diaminopimelate decarboxylase [Meiothermus granaticius]RIH92180.1 Diaminopimelate decarboxylase [Meiothermus granaticius NBRC 107808]GEM86583.1 diaminopimelate decarboxylase [Meiothermus granaticius NBRC 107808]